MEFAALFTAVIFSRVLEIAIFQVKIDSSIIS